MRSLGGAIRSIDNRRERSLGPLAECENELAAAARFQGRHVATIAEKLARQGG